MKELKQRVFEEIRKLETKVNELEAFVERGSILINKEHQSLLIIQLSQMNAYLNILKLKGLSHY